MGDRPGWRGGGSLPGSRQTKQSPFQNLLRKGAILSLNDALVSLLVRHGGLRQGSCHKAQRTGFFGLLRFDRQRFADEFVDVLPVHCRRLLPYPTQSRNKSNAKIHFGKTMKFRPPERRCGFV